MVDELIPNNRNVQSTQLPQEPFPTRRSIRAAETLAPKPIRTPAKPPVQQIAAPAYTDFAAAKASSRKTLQHRIIGIATVLLVPGIFVGSSIPAMALGNSDPAGADVSAASGQTLIVDTALDGTATVSRDGFDATTTQELKDKKEAAAAAKAAATSAGTTTASASAGDYSTVTPRAAGDDYPFRNGAGLSSMGYVIRQCTDFVAWRLNRDAGYTKNFKYVWSMMTPNGGSASQWASAWRNNGWKTSHKAVKGAVAWFYGNHVAYVKSVDGDQVNLEEYNWGGDGAYHTRTIDASEVGLFLYPPP